MNIYHPWLIIPNNCQIKFIRALIKGNKSCPFPLLGLKLLGHACRRSYLVLALFQNVAIFEPSMKAAMVNIRAEYKADVEKLNGQVFNSKNKLEPRIKQ